MMKTRRLRNLDMATVRSFSQIAELGSMTRAAERLNMTQSAVSMQIKRLEESLGVTLFDRATQGMKTTLEGDQLLSFANRLLALNDEAIGMMMSTDFEGEVRLGAPTDIVNPHLPAVLKQFKLDFPRAKVQLSTGFSRELLKQFDRGEQDLILTTEHAPRADAVILARHPLTWTGAVNGTAWKQRPLPLGLSKNCIFREAVTKALREANIDWNDQVVSDDELVAQAMVAADQCVQADLFIVGLNDREVIRHGDQLPNLPEHSIALYHRSENQDPLIESLVSGLKRAFV